MDTAYYMRRAEEFTARLNTEERLHLSGLKDTFETEAIFEESQELFTREAVFERLDHREDRLGRYLAEFAVRNYIEQRLRELTEQIADAESAAEVRLEGKPLSFYQALGQASQEADGSRRRALEEAATEAMSRHDEWRMQRIVGQREIARELGFADYRALCEDLSGQPLRALAQELAAFVEDTQSAYCALVDEQLGQAGIDSRSATDWDLRWVMFAPRYTEVFPGGRLLSAAEATLSALGVTFSKQPNVHLDLQPRPKKYPKPFCAPITVPGEVWVVASPRGGCADFLSFFHELGHALHFAGVDPELPCAYRIMGDHALTEAFAFLLQSVVLNRDWLRHCLGVEAAPESLFRAGRLIDHWCVRRCAGKIAYELELRGGDGRPARMAARYAHLLGHAFGVRVAPEQYLFDADDWFSCVRYLRAFMLDSCVRVFLRERFGRGWFRSPEAGEWLRSRWRRGTELTAEELAGELGFQLGIAPLRERLLANT